jgi:hypothetical protein
LRLRVVLAFALLLVVACAGGESRVTGTVTRVDGDLTQIIDFEVRPPGGDAMVFVPEDGLDVFGDGGTPLSHLFEHLQTGDPVRVTYRVEGGVRIAILIEDA